jgi:hypothetical protein
MVTHEQAANSLRRALVKVAKAQLKLRVFDGRVYVAPDYVELWPNGDHGSPIDILDAQGWDVTPAGLDADGGAGV